MAKSAKVVEQSTFSKADVAVAEKAAGLFGRGIKFLAELGERIGNHSREQFVKLAESKPEVATALVTYWQTVEVKYQDAQVAMNGQVAALLTEMVKGSATVLNTVASKVDFNKLVDVYAEQERAKLQHFAAEAKVDESRAAYYAAQAETEKARLREIEQRIARAA